MSNDARATRCFFVKRNCAKISASYDRFSRDQSLPTLNIIYFMEGEERKFEAKLRNNKSEMAGERR